MFKDVLIPSKIGNSYLFSKKVLSVDVTQFSVQAILVEYRGSRVYLKSKQSIVLKDFSQQAIIGAIKKIVSTIGSYDEVITSSSSSSVVFKELQLPFVGREKLEMIVAYEVEAMLPFSLDKAVIDFIVTHENKKLNSSKILVAAALKDDVDAQLALFEKAGVKLNTMTVDMFALYTLYAHGMYVPKIISGNKKNHKKSFFPENRTIEVFVDAGFSVTRILYLDNKVLQSVRVVPYGISDIAQSISKQLELSYYDVVQQLISQENKELYQDIIHKELATLFEHINQTVSFFEKQLQADYKMPQKIIFSGLGCSLYKFITTAQDYLNIQIQEISIEHIVKSLKVVIPKKMALKPQDITQFAIALLSKYNEDTNFLQSFAHRIDNSLLYKQLLMIVVLSISCIGAVYFKSSLELQRWNQAYISSKKELVSKVDQIMGVDLKSEKNLKKIVERCEEAFKASHKRWFAFVKQKERSYLEYLQDLSVKIDKESIGLDLTKLMIEPEKVTMVGKLKDFEALEVFEEELAELDLLQVVEKPRELSFTIQLKVKNKGQHDDH